MPGSRSGPVGHSGQRKGHLGWVCAIRRVYNVTVAHFNGVLGVRA